MTKAIGIFEAKTKLAEICTAVAEDGADFVITRRGQPVARLVPVAVSPAPASTSLLQRLRSAESAYGPIDPAGPDFPDVWVGRSSRIDSPLDDDPPSAPRPQPGP